MLVVEGREREGTYEETFLRTQFSSEDVEQFYCQLSLHLHQYSLERRERRKRD
jgi:hypothetical protein